MKRIYLRPARLAKDLTQEQLADRSGVDQVTISRLENQADAKPSFDTVDKLARALNVDPRQLRFGVEPERVSA